MSSSSLHHYSPIIVFSALLGIYLTTIAPVVYLGDSGEFTAAAFSLGIPHNSGYPLYGLVGKLFCMIPLGNIGFRVNLMSAFFSVLTLWVVYRIIHRITSSLLSSFIGSLSLAFTPIFWAQTVSAEVYPFHTFFVALLIGLLWWWDERREFSILILFVFITGISFGNHMQTVMLAPAVLFLILSADKKALLSFKNLSTMTIFFVFALMLYLYLPIRTNAGAAIHWGDPNNLDRFLTHVTATSHRHGYVLSKTSIEYFYRAIESLKLVSVQFGILLLFAGWGWLKLSVIRWRIFFIVIIIFDFVYTVFLNIISLEITPFGLPTCIVLSILVGNGIAHFLKWARLNSGIRLKTYTFIKIALCMALIIPFFFSRNLCDQSRNYTGYEHALNIFRTLDRGSTLFLDGDNNIFPVIYGRIVERMREDVTLYDRYNLVFKIPYLGEDRTHFHGKWEDVRAILEEKIIEKRAPHGVFFAVFDPSVISIPRKFRLVPYGILSKVVAVSPNFKEKGSDKIWNYYATESLYDDFEKDYMNRQVSAHFFFDRARYFFFIGQHSVGLKKVKLASRIAYNDDSIHSDIAVFLIDQGLFKEALQELEKASITNEDLSALHNNWGYYYHKLGDYHNAIESFRKAIEIRDDRFPYYNNLAFAFYEVGRKEDAIIAFQNSLAIKREQPGIKNFIRENNLTKSSQ